MLTIPLWTKPYVPILLLIVIPIFPLASLYVTHLFKSDENIEGHPPPSNLNLKHFLCKFVPFLYLVFLLIRILKYLLTLDVLYLNLLLLNYNQ